MSSAVTASSDSGPAIQFEDVRIGFDEGDIFRGVSFRVQPRETMILLGETGTGKTLTLKLAAGLLAPSGGVVRVLGQEVSRMEERDLLNFRRKVGFVFQEGALFDSMTVAENVAYRLREDRIAEEEIEARVLEVLRFVELEHTVDMLPSELSGGMRRRVGIARAIITHPEILLYDSPTGGLDPITSTTIIELIMKQRDVFKTSALLVSHRLQDGFMLASHYYDPVNNRMQSVDGQPKSDVHTSFMILREGKVIFDGTAHDLGQIQDPYIREYIS